MQPPILCLDFRAISSIAIAVGEHNSYATRIVLSMDNPKTLQQALGAERSLIVGGRRQEQMATPKANAGILRYAQNDKVSSGGYGKRVGKDSNRRSFDCVVRKCANHFAQDDRVGMVNEGENDARSRSDQPNAVNGRRSRQARIRDYSQNGNRSKINPKSVACF